jgi:SAM-dependent methyltransferase
MNLPFATYESGEYLSKNPTWDIEDSAWKASAVEKILKSNHLTPGSVVEVGCGAGGILAAMQASMPQAQYFGYEIAPSAASFWEAYKDKPIAFKVEDFLTTTTRRFDALLLLDVVEHLPNPYEFLPALKSRADYFVFHFPLDLSAVSVLREKPLLHVRDKVGHIHYFTKSLALSLLRECGYQVMDWSYTGAAFNAPQSNWKTRLARLPRRITFALNRDWGVRLLGGDTLMVLARPN